MRVVLALVVAVAAGCAGAQQCPAPAKTLTLSCGDACEPFAPCLLKPESTCDLECFVVNSTSHSAYSSFRFLLPYDATVGDTTVTAFKSSSAISKVEKLTLPTTATNFVIRGGSSITASEKGRVIALEFADSFLAENSKLVNVRFANINLAPVLSGLLAQLPARIGHLWVQNGLLAEFPDVSRFANLQIMALDYNYITTVDKTHENVVGSNFQILYVSGNNISSYTATFPKLIHLDLSSNSLTAVPPQLYEPSKIGTLFLQGNKIPEFKHLRAISNLKRLLVQQNKMTTFDAVMPNLNILHLGQNDFTELPIAIFRQDKLEELYMKDLKLVQGVKLTNEQANFFATLKVFEADQEMFSSDCSTSLQALVNGFTVCITGGDVNLDLINGARVVVPLPPSTTSPSPSGSQLSPSSDIGDGGGSNTPDSNSTNTMNNSRDSNTVTIVASVSAVGVFVVAVLLAFIVWKQRRGKQSTTASSVNVASSSPGTTKTKTNASSSKLSDDISIWSDPDMISVKLNLDDIKDVKMIGQGGFCEVWLVTYRRSRQLASKRLKETSRNRTQRFIEEIKLVAMLQHPRVVEFVGAAWNKEVDVQALFEFMENGDLRIYLEAPNTPRAWSLQKVQIAVDIAEALVYLHSFNPPLVHRDLKSRNVLLNASMQAKVTDFGVSRYQSEQSTMTAGVGTSRWLAPEVILGTKDYGPPVDIFSFGVVLSELDSHELPFSNARGRDGAMLTDMTVMQMVSTGDLRPQFSRACPPPIADLAQLCVSLHPDDRPSATEIAYALRLYRKSADGGFIV